MDAYMRELYKGQQRINIHIHTKYMPNISEAVQNIINT